MTDGRITSFDDVNRYQRTHADQLKKSLEDDAKQAEASGDSKRAKDDRAQIANLGRDDVIVNAAVQAIARQHGLDQDAVTRATAKYDQDGDGTVNHAEFDQLAAELPPDRAAPAATGASATWPATSPQQKRPGEVPTDKVGAVLNDNVANLPTADQLAGAGIGGVRITLTADNFTGTKENIAAWQAKLADYKHRQPPIDVTLQMGYDLAKDCPKAEITKDGALPPQSDAWKQKFDTWVDKAFMPRVNDVMNALGKQVDSVEVWNEPDEGNNRLKVPDGHGGISSYIPAIPAEQFGKLMQKTYHAVHDNPNAKPDVKVVSGGADSGHPEYLVDAANATPDPATGQPTLWADAMGLHPYGKQPTLPDSDDNSLGKIVDNYNQAGVKGPGSKDLPIYITEASQPNAEEEVSFNVNFAKKASTMPSVTRSYFFWHTTFDNHPGLIDNDGNPTPAYHALAKLTGME